MKRLRNATSIGWHNTVPVDIWSTIITYMPLTKHETLDLGIALRLLRVCKGMLCALAIPINNYMAAIITEKETWQKVFDTEPEDDKKACFTSMNWYLIERLEHKHSDGAFLTRYIKLCLLDSRYRTHEHISNCLSLLYYVYIHGAYAAEYSHKDYTGIIWCNKVFGQTMDYFTIHNIYYFHPITNKAVVLSRMSNVQVYTNTSFDDLYNLACAYLLQNGSTGEDIRVILSRKHKNMYSNQEICTLFGIIEKSESGRLPVEDRSFKTRKITVRDPFHSIIVTINGMRHHIYADECTAFRSRCHRMSDTTCADATIAYSLINLRERNETIIRDTPRFKTPIEVTLL